MNKKTVSRSLLILAATIIFFASPTINAQANNWKAPKIADRLKNPLKGDLSAVKKGKELFDINCVTCHGAKGLGDGIAASSLFPKPANLTSKEVQKQSDGAIYYKITKGKNAMISWKYSLSEKQRWQLVSYIRELVPHKAKVNVKKSTAKNVKLKKKTKI